MDDNNYKNKLTPEEIKLMEEKNGEDLEEYLNEVILPKLLKIGVKDFGFNGKVIKIVC